MIVDNDPNELPSSNLNLPPLPLPTPTPTPSSSSSSLIPPPFTSCPASLFPLPPSFSSSSSSSNSGSSTPTHYVYVLALEHDRYYVGRASSLPNLYQRWTQHWQGVATPFTSLFKPLVVVEVKETTDPFLEETTTLIYMMKYSIHQVRGGSMTSLQFTQEEELNLKLRLRSIQNVCYLCGEKGHFQASCPCADKTLGKHKLPKLKRKQDKTNMLRLQTNQGHFKKESEDKEDGVQGYNNEDDDDDDEEEDGNEIEIEVPTNCSRCGRYGHSKQHCQFKRDHQGQWLDIT